MADGFEGTAADREAARVDGTAADREEARLDGTAADLEEARLEGTAADLEEARLEGTAADLEEARLEGTAADLEEARLRRTAADREEARLERQRFRAADEPPRGRARANRPRRQPPPRRRPVRPRRKHSWVGRILALLALVAAAAVIWFLVELFQPFHGSPHGQATVTVPAHSTARQIGDQLAREGVVPSGFFFEARATLAGDRGNLRSGTYHLQLGMSYGAVLKILTTAPPAAKTTNITIVEGRTRAQINDLLRTQGIRGSYFAATRRSPLINFAAYGAPRHTPDLEGFLFPDTYQLVEPISVQKLVGDQLRTFRREFARVNLGYARSKHLTPYDVLIIASLVQGEAATTHDLPLVASVIYNRLRLGMPLQLDATTRYATGNYTKPLTQSQLNSPSAYNTRNHKGLTPTPIDSPGLAAIQAAAHPARTNFLYFVARVCGNGSSVFESNYNQFLADQAKYQQARSARGGRSPTRCK